MQEKVYTQEVVRDLLQAGRTEVAEEYMKFVEETNNKRQ